jgi:3-hydroxyacyl-CoA dehydrogenase
VLPLVELVRTLQTDDVALATAWAVTKKLRKAESSFATLQHSS